MNRVKIINGVKVPPLFYDKSCFKGAFIGAMIGLAGIVISIGSFIIYFSDSTGNIAETDVWELFVLSLFLLAMFLPTSLMLYASYTIMRIIDTLIDDSADNSTNK